MRKQIDFDIRVFDVVAGGNTSEGGMSHEQVREFVKVTYLDNGWEVLGVENTQISANHAFFAVYLAKYVDELAQAIVPQTLLEGTDSTTPLKRGPGRPHKSVETDAP